MVAYNFQAQFVSRIQSGEKTHTIRRNGKRRHAKPGDRLQLYTGMRTAKCKKILDQDPVCVDALAVHILVAPDSILSIKVGGQPIQDLNAFAVADGFQNLAAMHAFWIKFHGVGLFEGTLIEWRSP